MRFPVLSTGVCLTILVGSVWAQSTGNAVQQVPVGQTFKNFEAPIYEGGKLKFKIDTTEATGITQNRAETKDLKIDLYDNDKPSMTITSPKADLYVAERKMRTKNTVRIERPDMVATSLTCDFDLINKKYLLRTNVKVILKNFDVGKNTSLGDSTSSLHISSPSNPSTPRPPGSPASNDSLLDSPGTYSDTNSTPNPRPPDSK